MGFNWRRGLACRLPIVAAIVSTCRASDRGTHRELCNCRVLVLGVGRLLKAIKSVSSRATRPTVQ